MYAPMLIEIWYVVLNQNWLQHLLYQEQPCSSMTVIQQNSRFSTAACCKPNTRATVAAASQHGRAVSFTSLNANRPNLDLSINLLEAVRS